MDINKLKAKLKFRKISTYFNTNKSLQEAKAFVENVSYRHDVPQGDWVPADLKDTKGSWQLTKDGFPVAGQVLPSDVSIGSESPVLPAMNAILWTSFYISLAFAQHYHFFPMIFCLLSVWFLSSKNLALFEKIGVTFLMLLITYFEVIMAPMFSMFFSMSSINNAILLIPVFVPYLFAKQRETKRARNLALNGHRYKGAVLNSPNSKMNPTREKQALNAYKDQKDGYKFIEFGDALGILSFMGNQFAPDKGIKIGLSSKDLTKHLIIFGLTRIGKTTSIIRQILKFILGSDCGLWLTDGKHSLPKEIKSEKVKMIHPDTVKHFNFFKGLEPTKIANIVRNVLMPQSESGHNEEFKMAAEIMYADILIFRQALIDYNLLPENYRSQITVKNWYEKQIPVDEEKKPQIERHPLIAKIAENEELLEKMMEDGTVLNASYLRFLEYQNKSGDERKLYTFTLNSWISPFTQNEKLSVWLDSVESDVELERINLGEQFSMALSKDEFQLCGEIITKLTNNRVYKIIQERGENWRNLEGHKQVYLVTDECHDIYDKGTVDAIAKIAGFGGTFIASTQTFESLEIPLGQLGAQKLFDGFRNFGTFRSSHRTYQKIAEKVGEGHIWSETAQTQTIAFSTTAQLNMSEAIFDLNNPSRASMVRAGMQKGLDNTAMFSTSSAFNRIFGLQNIHNDDLTYDKTGIASFHLSERAVPYFNEKVIDALNAPFTCFFQFERADVPRLDVLQAYPLLPDFSPMNIDEANRKLKEELGIN